MNNVMKNSGVSRLCKSISSLHRLECKSLKKKRHLIKMANSQKEVLLKYLLSPASFSAAFAACFSLMRWASLSDVEINPQAIKYARCKM